MSTADTFREIDNLATEARSLLALGRDYPASRSAAGHMLGVQQLAQNGLREVLGNQRKLAAYNELLAACRSLLCDIDCIGHPGTSSVERVRAEVAEATK